MILRIDGAGASVGPRGRQVPMGPASGCAACASGSSASDSHFRFDGKPMAAAVPWNATTQPRLLGMSSNSPPRGQLGRQQDRVAEQVAIPHHHSAVAVVEELQTIAPATVGGDVVEQERAVPVTDDTRAQAAVPERAVPEGHVTLGRIDAEQPTVGSAERVPVRRALEIVVVRENQLNQNPDGTC